MTKLPLHQLPYLTHTLPLKHQHCRRLLDALANHQHLFSPFRRNNHSDFHELTNLLMPMQVVIRSTTPTYNFHTTKQRNSRKFTTTKNLKKESAEYPQQARLISKRRVPKIKDHLSLTQSASQVVVVVVQPVGVGRSCCSCCCGCCRRQGLQRGRLHLQRIDTRSSRDIFLNFICSWNVKKKISMLSRR